MKIPGIADKHSLLFNRSKGRWVLKRKVGAAWKTADAAASIRADQPRAAAAWGRALLLAPAPSPAPATVAEDERTVRQFFEVWGALLETRPKVSADSRERYLSNVRANVLPALGDKRFAEVDAAAVRGLVRSWRGALAPLTMGLVLSRLAILLDDAQAEGWMARGPNPARDRLVRQELPEQVRRSGKTIVRVPVAHAQALISSAAIPLHWRFRYLVAFGLGLRDGELAALRRSSLRLDAAVPQVDVFRSISARTRGEQKTKTLASKRTLPVPRALLEPLRWWLEEGFELAYGQGPLAPDGYLFVGARGPAVGKATRPKSADRIRKDLARLELPTTFEGFPITMHATRRSLGSWLRAAGVDVATVGLLLGHEGETVTEQSYVGVDLSLLQAAIDRMPLVWPGARGADLGAGAEVFAPSNAASARKERAFAGGSGGLPQSGHIHEGDPASLENGRSPGDLPGSVPDARNNHAGKNSGSLVLGTIGTTPAPLAPRSDWLPDARLPTPAVVAVLRRARRSLRRAS